MNASSNKQMILTLTLYITFNNQVCNKWDEEMILQNNSASACQGELEDAINQATMES